ncbi:MAG: hypothetical protein ACRC1T_05210 [Clostridium chrysemydis]|uniref:hypothetical protein n=1 Tax=Clostridium chrysemydis TaxID=2665504 RepID=UPI003F2AF561
MEGKQILEGYLETLEKFEGDADKYRNKYKGIIEIGNHEEIKNAIIEVKEAMTREYYNRLSEAASKLGVDYLPDSSHYINK